MTRPGSFARGPRWYRRGLQRHPSSGRTFLIVTEGLKTEPNYLHRLRDRLKLSTADVVIHHPEGTDPITLTKFAIKRRDERKKLAKKYDIVGYDEVWVVFDLEKPHDERHRLAKEAMTLKEAKSIHFAVSNPSFEFWLLLHEEYTTHPFRDSDEVEKRFNGHWKGYDKSWVPPPPFIEKLPVAVKYAEGCRAHHRSCKGDGNPSTDMDILARSLNTATRANLQFSL
jgi:RloB-like protein